MWGLNMKKFLVITLSILLISIFTSYAATDAKETSNKDTAKVVAVKTGVGVICTATRNSKNAGPANGLVQTEITLVTVLVDDNGVIRDCVIDMGYSGIQFTKKGVIDKKSFELCSSKADLGTKYGMGANSKIGKEWNEQVASLADYVTGKTLKEVEGIAIDSGNGKSTEPDLMNSVTFRIADIHSAIKEAVNNAKHLGASSNDKLSLGMCTSVGSDTKNAGKKNGVAETVYDFAAITYDANNKVTSSVIDEVKNDVLFSKKGIITTNLGVEIKSKMEDADKNKDWCVQTKTLSDYMIGKTTDEISKINIGSYVSNIEAELSKKVTIQFTNIMNAILKAGSYIK